MEDRGGSSPPNMRVEGMRDRYTVVPSPKVDKNFAQIRVFGNLPPPTHKQKDRSPPLVNRDQIVNMDEHIG